METNQPTTDPSVKNKGGRPKGSLNKKTMETIEAARAKGQLPHEFLAQIARGEPVESFRLNAETGEIEKFLELLPMPVRIDAAKAAAPYFAPKISTVEVISGVSDDELDAIIRGAAAQAGISLSDDGEGEEDEGQATPTVRERKRVTYPT